MRRVLRRDALRNGVVEVRGPLKQWIDGRADKACRGVNRRVAVAERINGRYLLSGRVVDEGRSPQQRIDGRQRASGVVVER